MLPAMLCWDRLMRYIHTNRTYDVYLMPPSQIQQQQQNTTAHHANERSVSGFLFVALYEPFNVVVAVITIISITK